MRDVLCRACTELTSSIRYIVNGYELRECPRCHSLTAATSLEGEEAQSFYSRGYFHGGDYEDYEASRPTEERNFRRFVDRMRQVQEGGRLLELGCAYGYFLDLAQPFWHVSGVDISADAIASCAGRFGSAVWCGELPSFPADKESYDWVVGWDVIEHLARPRDYMKRALELLKPGGHLALTTGDVGSAMARLRGRNWRLLTPPSHLTFFSRAGMRLLLRSVGFEALPFSTAGYDRTWALACFRLLGPEKYQRWSSRYRQTAQRLRERSFYLDLGDIMFVSARRPPRGPVPNGPGR